MKLRSSGVAKNSHSLTPGYKTPLKSASADNKRHKGTALSGSKTSLSEDNLSFEL
jgi:hypothetical protein